MEKYLDIIRVIVDILAVIIAGGWLIRLFTVKSRIKQEKAEAEAAVEKSVEAVKADQLENIKKTFIELYQPVIDDLERRLSNMGDKVDAVESENQTLKKEVAELKEENGRLKKENEELRDALREIRPDVVPSRRSVNATNQKRNEKGQFAAKEETE